MAEHKLLRDYSLGNVTMKTGGTIEVNGSDKVKALQLAGFIAQPKKKKVPDQPKADSEEIINQVENSK